jgi:ATP-binding cassette subfamily G (WHITE) protein 2
VLFFCVINQGIFAALVVINSFPSERLLVLRERAAGTYYASAYFLAKVTAEVLLQLPIPVLFSAIVYWLVGLQASAAKFFIFCGFMVLCNMAATSLALMVSTWCRTVDLSVSVLPMMLELARLFGGFFLSPANLPSYFVWLDALSYVKYTYIGISLNELTGLVLTCTEAQAAAAGGKCPVATGEQTIQQLGMGKYSIPLCAGVLVVYIVVCRAVAYAGLRVVKW